MSFSNILRRLAPAAKALLTTAGYVLVTELYLFWVAQRLLGLQPGQLRDIGVLPAFLSIAVALQVVLALGGLALFRFVDRRPWSEFGFAFGARARWLTLGSVLLYAAGMAFLVWLWRAIGKVTLYSGYVQFPLFVRAAVACGLAGVYEEFLFRGYIFRTLRSYSRSWAYLISILLFALVHFTRPDDPFGWMRLSGLISATFLYTLVYDLSGSIWPGVILHGVYDLMATVTLQNKFGVSWLTVYGDVPTLGLVSNVAVHLPLAVLAIVLYRRKFLPEKGRLLSA